VGTAGIKIDPTDEAGLREALLQLTDDATLWEQQVSASLAQAARFSWEKCASETVAIYRRVLEHA
jgi:glycosyltransferase involved in cell wall biosynthesis